MPYFSKRSLARLTTSNPLLQEVAHEAIKYVDFSVEWGHRTKEPQDRFFAAGLSHSKWPTSKHNSWPSKAIDVIPYPGGWKSRNERFFFVAGVFIVVAKMKNISIRWGGDWDGNLSTKEKFEDLAHFELLENH